MKYTCHMWLFIAFMMCVLLSMSAVAQNKIAISQNSKIIEASHSAVVSARPQNCPTERPVFDGKKCVECVMTLDCVGNRICDDNTCHCPGVQEFNPAIKDCACNPNKYPVGENTNKITCDCKNGFELIKQEDATFACVDPDTLVLEADIDTSHLEGATNEFIMENEKNEDAISEEFPVQNVE